MPRRAADLPSDLRSNPIYRKINPADAPALVLALTSDTIGQGRLYDAASNVLQQKLSQVTGRGPGGTGRQLAAGGAGRDQSQRPVEVPHRAGKAWRAALAAANANTPKGAIEVGDQHWQIYTNDQARTAAEYRDPDRRLAQRRAGPAERRGGDHRFDRRHPQRGPGQRQALGAGDHLPAAQCQHHRDRRQGEGAAARAAGRSSQRRRRHAGGPTAPPRSAPRCARSSARAHHQRHPGGAGDLRISCARRGAGLVPSVAVPVIADRHVRHHVSDGLQPQQPVADGHDHRGWLRGRPTRIIVLENVSRPHRGRHAAPRGGIAGARRARSVSPWSR